MKEKTRERQEWEIPESNKDVCDDTWAFLPFIETFSAFFSLFITSYTNFTYQLLRACAERLFVIFVS